MSITTFGHVPPRRRDALAEEVRHHRTMEHVVRWAFARELDIDEVIVQDEFTHDVIVTLSDGRVLVYDST